MTVKRTIRVRQHALTLALGLGAALGTAFGTACGRGGSEAAAPATATAAKSESVAVQTAAAVEESLARFLSVTGTLVAEEQAEVAAEVAGRIVATPVERGTPVGVGAVLVRVAAAEVDAQAREAEANVAQIQARLGQATDEAFDVERVPEVASARASRDLAQADFDRITMLYERKLVSRAEHDMRKAQAENAARQYDSAKNAAEQQRQALAASGARLELARKAVADATVRAPFAGLVAERAVSVGDYVTRGTRVATVVRVNPLRVELTVPAQFLASVAVGREVTLQVDAYPDHTFTGQVRYVSPNVRADSRALVVEAVVPNAKGLLKPGLFVTARLEQGAPTPGVLVPQRAVQTVAGTSRVFVVANGQVDERIVTTGQVQGDRVEVTSGLSSKEVVAVGNLATLSDGAAVSVTR